MSEASEKILIDLLIKDRVFSQEDYTLASKNRKVHDVSLRKFVVEQKLVSESQILDTLSRSQSYPIADINDIQPDNDIISKVSLIQASTFNLFPLRIEEDTIIFGMVDVLDQNLFDDMRFSYDFPYQIELLSPKDLEDLLSRYYSDETERLGDLEISFAGEIDDLSDDDREVLDNDINDTPVVKLLNNILMQAINDHASDVHFEPFELEFKIRYRIDGTLYEMVPPPRHLAESVLSRIKVMARMNIAEKRVPQDGRISLKIQGKLVDLRVSTLPTAFGESAVLRVLDRSHINLELNTLGFTSDMLKLINEIIQKPNGIFITTGPTGAGKTTTLYSCLREINTVDSKVITTEDPVEYEIDGLVQVPIKDSIGLTFAAALRSILRQDPDRIMVGEIRDLQTMNMAIQASLTGHLVLTTLHTNDAPSAITRLIDMGVEPFLISSSIEGILAQRLVRKICESCKSSFTPKENMLELIGLRPEDVHGKKFYQGEGCDDCGGIGYRGRLGIYELLTITDEIRELITERATAKMIKEVALRNGMVTLLADGIQKVEAGITTIEEVAAVANQDD